MNLRKMTALAVPAAAAIAFAGTVALANEAATTASPAGTAANATAPQAAKTDITPQVHQAIVGLPVISADGQTVGQVMSVGPGTNSKSMSLSVKTVDGLDAKSAEVKIPVDRAVLEGRTVQLIVSFDEVKKFYVR